MRYGRWLTVAAALAAAAPAAAQINTPPPADPSFGGTRTSTREVRPGIQPADVGLQSLYELWTDLVQQRKRLDDRLRDTLTKFAVNSPQVEAIRNELDQVTADAAAAKQKIDALIQDREQQSAGRGRRLLRPVAVQLENATVRQAAEALSQATKLSIRVEGEIPNDTRLNVQARGVTLGAVLEAIGRQANLKLAPTEDGVVISPWPMVAINGQQQVFRGRLAPWSSDWGLLPGYASRDGWVFPGEADAADVPYTVVAQLPMEVPGMGGVPLGVPYPAGSPLGELSPTPSVDPAFARLNAGGGKTGRTLSSAALAISMASLGDRSFAVSEPGQGPEGQQGAWITVYRIEGTQLKKVATGFHALRSTPQLRGRQMGMPGMAPTADPAAITPAGAPSPFIQGGALTPSATVPGGFPEPGIPAPAPASAGVPGARPSRNTTPAPKPSRPATRKPPAVNKR